MLLPVQPPRPAPKVPPPTLETGAPAQPWCTAQTTEPATRAFILHKSPLRDAHAGLRRCVVSAPAKAFLCIAPLGIAPALQKTQHSTALR